MMSVEISKDIANKPNEIKGCNNEQADRDWTDKTNTDVLFTNAGINGLITLNRPNALNVLKGPMCQRIIETLKEWESDKRLVIIEGAGDKAFCAGGDLKLLEYATQPNVDKLKKEFFGTLYRLFYLIGTYKIPYIALMNNITMGNGAGLCVHAKYRIVTERSVFSMPEVSLGFHPDGGTTHVFSRLKGNLGLFFGLTAHKLKGIDILRAGIATHYVPSERLDDLKKSLLSSNHQNIEEVIQKYHSDMPNAEFSLAPYLDKIDRCFSAPTIEELMNRLEEDGSQWAKDVARRLNRMSPTSLKVTRRTIEKGKGLSFSECVKMEYRVSLSFVYTDSDFCRGIKLLKNTKPVWKPATLKEVTEENVMRRFEPLHPNIELQL
ncbi:hypothetical protein KM043_007012 [Ampulex compressa]|nr:hypothetical protein KM043_007012 [Ampulex compressa]